ncbi:penicillin-binding protein 1A [Entomobacter blattae]|uniref:Penicillin-binding protein 1A n=1 Tax=Entomobacter blattae TaxID=2762277 RepID=A0A7H1NP29_9PROT|nr:PBP1A family penicillin-binding protein [Entomobacter blattae]QNT77539.1 Penicillin-binding protein 1A [Entomobacter blattae]
MSLQFDNAEKKPLPDPGLEKRRSPPLLRRPRFRMWRRLVGGVLGVVLLGVIGGGSVFIVGYEKLVGDLPTVDGLKNYQPQVMSRIYASDDQLMAELAAERRIFVPYYAIPDRVKQAFISAEDQKFYSHNGVDPLAIIRAGLTDLTMSHGKRPIGASTITQQVSRIMLLGSVQTLSVTRKIREALLAMRVEQSLPKERILEIYLNEIYLGNGAYGIAAASEAYFNKPLNQLDNAEVAFLAALPKSPANYNPYRYPDVARGRRNWVLERMVETGALSRKEADEAKAEPLVPKVFIRPGPVGGSEWFAEAVRRELIERFGKDKAMEGGLIAHTSMDPKLQASATALLHEGLINYDRRHNRWHGPVGHIQDVEEGSWQKELRLAKAPSGLLYQWRLGVILTNKGKVGWLDGRTNRRMEPISHTGMLTAKDLGWMRNGHAFHVGDLVMVEPQSSDGRQSDERVTIQQIPTVEGALVSVDVHTGRVLALVGGWSFDASQFNRATQALRQPGSSFKPIVYLTAMEQNISPSQKFEDAPFSSGDWHPSNYEKDFWGSTTLHDALRGSRNLVTIRLAAHVGMSNVAKMAIALHEVDSMPKVLPAALGAVETTVLREAGAYASIAAQGKVVVPSLVDYVQDRDGQVIWHSSFFEGKDLDNPSIYPQRVDKREEAATPQSAFQIITMMEDVIKRGTGRRAGEGITQPIAGKTGTSQNFNDAWFAGFSPDVVTIVWMGFDKPQSLGKNETGGVVAGPIWNKFMKEVFQTLPATRFVIPSGITLAQYNTGRGIATDAFKPGQKPGASANLWGKGSDSQKLSASDTGAENLPLSESDMESGGGAVSSGGASSYETGRKKTVDAPSAGGDIGMGGLY